MRALIVHRDRLPIQLAIEDEVKSRQFASVRRFSRDLAGSGRHVPAVRSKHFLSPNHPDYRHSGMRTRG